MIKFLHNFRLRVLPHKYRITIGCEDSCYDVLDSSDFEELYKIYNEWKDDIEVGHYIELTDVTCDHITICHSENMVK